MDMDSRTVRRAWIALGLALCAALVLTPVPSRGQDKSPAAKKQAAEKESAGPSAAAPDQSAKNAKDSPPSAAGKKGPGKEVVEKGFIRWIIECSGIIGGVILLLSIYFVSTVSRLFWEMRIDVAAPPELVLQCEELLAQRNLKGIYQLVKDDESFFARLLTTGIAELPNGLAEAREAMDRLGDAITAEMEKKISMLAVLGTLGPMIGLLGTLQGMISSFGVIARSGQELKAGEVAAGISQALVLTFEGVSLSVPAIYFHALFRNRVITIASSVMLTADQFLRHFSHAGRSKAAAVVGTMPPGPPAMPG
jgi:biopolymer transport protein ExbB